ncbi:MAG: methionine--tRNA ligase [Candidatus Cloacimonetes bacterium]|nr:methionine--tRNA ligase [Candidatus Cloacimonadota bacterium]
MKYIVTSALPYANGMLHVGHVAGAYLPADIFVRFLRLKGEDVVYICGTDEHGTPISISADKEGISPNDVVDRYHASIKEAFDGVGIEFDSFSGTARPPHHKLAQEFFLSLYEKKHIQSKSTQQFYCEHDKRYLPDRYVEGICPRCGATNASGDQCDKCGQIYDTITLVTPKCKICGNEPIIRDTVHWFLHLDSFREKIRDWLSTKEYWKENVRNFMLGLLEQGLIERSITRDLSWGVPVPLPDAEGKVLYVWFDAPIGYISSTIEWAAERGTPDLWKDYWLDPSTRLIHFIGKDNIIFHALIWPAMLMGQDQRYCLPYDIPANEFMNLEGQKISTSRNWAIWVDEFVKEFDGEYLRYYLAVNAPEKQDSDFSLNDFQLKINGDLNNTLGNLANRVFAFTHKNFQGNIVHCALDEASQQLLTDIDKLIEEIENGYADYQVKKNTRLIMDIARLGNKYFDERKPWMVIKEDKEAVNETLFVCYNILAKISVCLTPILPKHCRVLRQMMNLPESFSFGDAYGIAANCTVLNETRPLFSKLEDATIEAQILKLKQSQAVSNEQQSDNLPPEASKATITYDDFAKLDIRLAKVISAERIPKTENLLKLQVEIGDLKRELVAGIAQNYSPEELLGKTIVMLVNLEPKTIRGITSQGMILASHSDGKINLIVPDKGGVSGSTVK